MSSSDITQVPGEPRERKISEPYRSRITQLIGEIEKVPIAKEMGFEIVHYDGSVLQMSAPLEANINDKQTAFGGSLASLAMLSGWSYVVLAMPQSAAERSDTVIVESSLKFIRPVKHRFYSEVSVEASECERFHARFERKGRAKLSLTVTVYDETESKPAMTMQAVYAAAVRSA